ncbi:PREDICTED: uncharacterized protein LOC105565807, partial [Vollenhovia emeryi]|uniref:uncharacterized protein LOC105565807 n=1 Tax=Vollenhovia emeryi TaxID=411798 RepID=UPI0005F513D4
MRVRYLINSQRERRRQKELPSDRKWLYNKRYYEKKKLNYIHTKKNHDIAKNITKKYKKLWSSHVKKLSNPLAVTKIFEKLDIKDPVEKRLEAERIVRWSMCIKENYSRNMQRILTSLKKKAEICLTVADECSTIDDKLRALCGISRHTASSENYFIDSYREITSSQQPLLHPLIMNVEGQVTNVLPLIQARAKKAWLCSASCKTDDRFLIERYRKFLEALNACTLKKITKLLEKIHK